MILLGIKVSVILTDILLKENNEFATSCFFFGMNVANHTIEMIIINFKKQEFVSRSITGNILLSLVSRGDVARNYFTSEDDHLPEEPEYDKFAYENDRKMWGLDNSYNEDEGVDGLRSEARKERRLHYTSGTVSLTRIG